MTSTLPRVTHEHHERLMRHVDQMPGVGDMIGAVPSAELRPHVEEMCSFLTGLLIPHMDAAEATLYPELERLLQNRHSMTPMKREHAEIRGLVEGLVRMDKGLEAGHRSVGEAVALRRGIFRLYAFLKVHLAEEQLYLDLIEHGVTPEAGEALASAMEHVGMAEF
jgi:hypothetical protein